MPPKATRPPAKSVRSSTTTVPKGPVAAVRADAAAIAGKIKPWKKAEIEEAFGRFREGLPEPKGELEYVNPYTLLVAVVLSAQATDVGVNKATRDLFARADTPEKMYALGEDDVRDAVKTIGLYRAKAKNVIALSRLLIEEHGSQVPRDRAALETLPGVGRKTANVVLNIAFGHPTVAVDTHIHRVANRTGIARTRTPEQTERALLARVPEQHLLNAHHYLILHGRYTCVARLPKCPSCPIRRWCRYPDKTAVDAAMPS